MTLLPYLLASSRVLVVVPTQLLREQIADEFGALTILRTTHVVPQDVWSPRVAAISTQTAGDAWDEYIEKDVVVSAPNSLVVDGECSIPNGFFDLVLFDEGHHSAADMWQAVAKTTRDAKQVLFTATPYRRDEQRILGTIVYEFPLAEAVAQGYVAPVDLQLIDGGDDSDEALIAAIALLVQDPESEYFQVPFIARTSSKQHARELRKRYADSGLDVRTVLDDVSLRTAIGHINAVRDGEAQGLVMVGVLGEGFNFPAIKLAAYHRAHKSLPATLQFLGRLTRLHGDGPECGLVVATQESGGDETRRLYQSDAQWATLIPQLADELFQREARRALFERELQSGVQGEVSPANVKAKYNIDIYTVDEHFQIDVAAERAEDPSVISWWQTDGFLVVIKRHDEKPDWLHEPVLVETTFELRCVVHARDERLLFVSSTHDTQAVLAFLKATEVRPASPDRLFAMLNAQGVEAYFNVGMRSIEIPNEKRAAYMINAGKSVGGTIRPEDSATYTLGHAIAKINDNGTIRNFGVSIRKAKVWMPRSEPLADFYQWCMSLARLLHRSQPATMATGLSLRSQAVFDHFPSIAVAAMPGERLFESDARLVLSSGSVVALADLNFVPRVSQDRLSCQLLARTDDDDEIDLTVDINGVVTVSTHGVVMTLDGVEVNAATELTTAGVSIFFGDGSMCRGPLLSASAPGLPPFPATHIELPDWENVDCAHEVHAIHGKISIFEYLEARFSAVYPQAIIVNDNNALELADILIIRDLGAHVDVHLIHCKGGAFSERVDLLYDVVGQAQRSMRWVLNRAAFWREVARRLRERPSFQIRRDPMQDAAERFQVYAEAAPVTDFRIAVAQPGLYRTALRQGTAANQLLTSCKASADAAGAQFSFICSDRPTRR